DPSLLPHHGGYPVRMDVEDDEAPPSARTKVTIAARLCGAVIGVGVTVTLAIARVFYPRELVLRGGYDLAAGERPTAEMAEAEVLGMSIVVVLAMVLGLLLLTRRIAHPVRVAVLGA